MDKPQAVQEPQDQIAQEPRIAPAPIPEIFRILPCQMADGSSGVMVVIENWNGTTFHFLEREAAREIASNIRRTTEGGPGLLVPKTQLVSV